jgi:predicted HicB family RNase H-like nuclease
MARKTNQEIKTKILLTIPADLKDELNKEASEVNRSLNNYIFTVLLERNK